MLCLSWSLRMSKTSTSLFAFHLEASTFLCFLSSIFSCLSFFLSTSLPHAHPPVRFQTLSCSPHCDCEPAETWRRRQLPNHNQYNSLSISQLQSPIKYTSMKQPQKSSPFRILVTSVLLSHDDISLRITSKALVTSSDALVSNSFLFLVVRPLLLVAMHLFLGRITILFYFYCFHISGVYHRNIYKPRLTIHIPV